MTLTATDDQGLDTTYALVDITASTPPMGGNQTMALTDGSGGVEVSGAIAVGTAGANFTIESWIKLDERSTISNVDGLFRGADDAGKIVDVNFFGATPQVYSRAEGDLTKSTTAH